MPNATPPTARGSQPFQQTADTPCAVLIDGSALFLAVRTLYENTSLNYRALIEILVETVRGLHRPTSITRPPWVMWTSASPQNQGQVRFLEFVENELSWEVRRVSPVDSYMVEPVSVLGLSDSRAASRLVRFDASIAFALGRLATSHRVVVLTDSFALADPMMRTATIVGSPSSKPVLAFFGRAIDARWHRVLGKHERAPDWLDLDDHEEVLFGTSLTAPHRSEVRHADFVF